MQNRLQRRERRDAERENNDGDKGRGCNGKGGNDLVFPRAGFCTDGIARVDGAGNFHIDQVASDKSKISAARAEHGGID